MSDLMFFIRGLLRFSWSLIILPLLFLIPIGLFIAGMIYFDISIPWWGALIIAFFLSAIINGFKAPQNK
ncbi:hypothetical protein L5B97_09775 [Avibacterium sp. 20-15]|uniref:Transmembrane protein n=1 Tax=Avibacterium gallinarum TaxID=755 RepID=A0A379B0U6_AVIGA|nr:MULTISPECIES: hypothetical protein [Avibacterium]MCW9733743.1 hypothetical protein [Avibacterium sp. 20-15]POY44103.1 hypothetical protein C3007_07235 [Avibacterium gallinarum]TDP29093.1 hypothetical protein EV689_1039 [Avibacterium gallinarum]URL03592.1 hypothetical protein L4F93_08465 [Avibacterium sp. 20-132]SUB28511.1 Uncharacterised protein [Avibacterium gallinarum]